MTGHTFPMITMSKKMMKTINQPEPSDDAPHL